MKEQKKDCNNEVHPVPVACRVSHNEMILLNLDTFSY